MRVEQRRHTTIDLHDGKARSFLVQTDERGWRLTAASKDDVLHLLCAAPDLERLRQEILKSNLTDYWNGNTALADVAEPTPAPGRPGRSFVRLEERPVTTVRLPVGKFLDCNIQPDDRGHRITCSTHEEIVVLHLPAYDLHRLRDALHLAPASSAQSPRRRSTGPSSRSNATEWLAYN